MAQLSSHGLRQQMLAAMTLMELSRLVAINSSVSLKIMGDFSAAICLPCFANDLIAGVFNSAVAANQRQMQQYLELARRAGPCPQYRFLS